MPTPSSHHTREFLGVTIRTINLDWLRAKAEECRPNGWTPANMSSTLDDLLTSIREGIPFPIDKPGRVSTPSPAVKAPSRRHRATRRQSVKS